jgi:DNA-binding IclR family transcriptional regulator
LAGSASVSLEVGNAVRLQEWLKRSKRREVAARNVMQFGPYAIREAPAARAALRLLRDHGWLLTGREPLHRVHCAVGGAR